MWVCVENTCKAESVHEDILCTAHELPQREGDACWLALLMEKFRWELKLPAPAHGRVVQTSVRFLAMLKLLFVSPPESASIPFCG